MNMYKIRLVDGFEIDVVGDVTFDQVGQGLVLDDALRFEHVIVSCRCIAAIQFLGPVKTVEK